MDAYVFFHLPGQFLNEDSLSKVWLQLVGGKLGFWGLIEFHFQGWGDCGEEALDWTDLRDSETGACFLLHFRDSPIKLVLPFYNDYDLVRASLMFGSADIKTMEGGTIFAW